MMSSHNTTAFVVALFLFMASSTLAGNILLSTDGVYEDNAQTAGALGYTVSSASLSEIMNMSQATLSNYDAVLVSPGFGSTSYNNLRVAVAFNGSLQEFVSQGGRLVVSVAGNWGDQANIAPNGVDYMRNPLHNAETIQAPNHAYITGIGSSGHTLTESTFDNWYQTDHGYLTGLPFGTTTILQNADGASMIEYPVGEGSVVVTTLTIGWSVHENARGDAQENLIDYAMYDPIPEPATLLLFGLGSAVLLRRR